MLKSLNMIYCSRISKHTHNISVTIMLIAIYWRLKFDAYAFPWNQIFFFLDNIFESIFLAFLVVDMLASRTQKI